MQELDRLGESAAAGPGAEEAVEEDACPEELFEVEVIEVPPAPADSTWLWDSGDVSSPASDASTELKTGRPPRFPFPTMQVYNEAAVVSTLKALDGKLSDRDERSTYKARLEAMREIGGTRRLAQFGPYRVFRTLDVLDRMFPNFKEVTGFRGINGLQWAYQISCGAPIQDEPRCSTLKGCAFRPT